MSLSWQGVCREFDERKLLKELTSDWTSRRRIANLNQELGMLNSSPCSGQKDNFTIEAKKTIGRDYEGYDSGESLGYI